jgi:hypothetical protein
MKRKIAVLILISLASSMSFAKEKIEDWGPMNVDGGKEKCTKDTGTEIKKYQTFEATGDRFFKDFQVRKISGWAPRAHSCTIAGVEEKEITLKSESGYDVKVKVPFRYTVYAHADCGSGTGAVVAAKTINIECEASAKLVKYTND